MNDRTAEITCYSMGMLLVLRLFWGIVALELLVSVVPVLRIRQIMAAILAAPLVASSVALLSLHPSFPTLLLLIITVYRVCNLLRLAKGRINDKYLRRATLATSVWTIGLQLIVTLLWLANVSLQVPPDTVRLALGCTDIVVAVMLLASTVRHLWTTRAPKLSARAVADADLPTVTVCIPARNETGDLETCLASLVASNYPKLEVLVLDDCSQNKRTPEIIRSFAHDGVRFLQGTPPEDNWLAKNHAYQQLLDQANGELILFSGVDVRYGPDSLRALVGAMLRKRKSMISVIPKNVVPAAFGWQGSTLLQPMRYAWELALPRRLFRRPPVLSTCWLVRRDLLLSAGGFGAVSRSIVPESYFARVSAVHDGYSFMQSSEQMGIISDKSRSEQRATTVRTRYPQVHRRIEMVLLLTLAELACVLMPYIFLVIGLFGFAPVRLTILSAVTVGLLTITYACIVGVAYRSWLVRSLVALPFVVLVDVVLLNESMIRYEFFDVDWKGRNVCIPVMRVEQHS